MPTAAIWFSETLMNNENSLDVMQKSGNVIYIGLQRARIVQVTRQGLDYIDQNGNALSIDLPECAETWSRYFDQHRNEFILLGNFTQEDVDAENATIVALRGRRYVQFIDEKRTRFEFANDLERWKLQGALFKVGWTTFDIE